MAGRQLKDQVVVLHESPFRPSALLQDLRRTISLAIERAVPPGEQALVKALVVGQKGLITPSERAWLSRAENPAAAAPNVYDALAMLASTPRNGDLRAIRWNHACGIQGPSTWMWLG